MSDLNPRYLAFCAAIGKTPKEERADVAASGQGTSMLDYVEWNTARLREWAAEQGAPNDHSRLLIKAGGHGSYDAWLQAWVQAEVAS